MQVRQQPILMLSREQLHNHLSLVAQLDHLEDEDDDTFYEKGPQFMYGS